MSAEVDLGVTEQIVGYASPEELKAFRVAFQRQFKNPDQKYELSNEGDQSEFRAMMLVVSLMLLNVVDLSGPESGELIPFVAEFTSVNSFFSRAGQAMAAILFGTAKSRVSSEKNLTA